MPQKNPWHGVNEAEFPIDSAYIYVRIMYEPEPDLRSHRRDAIPPVASPTLLFTRFPNKAGDSGDTDPGSRERQR